MSALPKILIISIDCWRSDALSRTNPALLTPKFDFLTRDFQLAERFFVTAPATRPSHTSLFTGLYPFEHGLYGQTYLKMFAGVTNLFTLLESHGFDVGGRSQRPEVFRFLDYEPNIGAIDPSAANQMLGSLEPTLEWLDAGDRPQLRFLHFWYTHGGYGLSGIELPTGLRELVRSGRAEEALQYYYAAAVHVQEFLLVEILKNIDIGQWTIFIFGDHGEGFGEEIMDHGSVLHQGVARVPLLAYIPRPGWSLPSGTLSMIDLYPTICELAGIDSGYRGFGKNLLDGGNREGRRVLTELDSLFGVGFLHKGNLGTAHARVTSRTSIDGSELDRNPDGVRQWALTDGSVFFRQDERRNEYCLRDVITGAELACEEPDEFRQYYQKLRQTTAYGDLGAKPETEEERAALEDRLRDLGYL